MKKVVILFALVILLPIVAGVSSDLADVYLPKETMIGEISGGILASISPEQVKVVRDEHIEVAVEYGVKKLGSKHYIWLISPENPGNYTLKIKEIIALVDGVPEVVDYSKDFRVEGLADYSIKPGFVLAVDDFEIVATLYESVGKSITVDFPESREISLLPGINYIDFSIAEIVGVQEVKIGVGKYSVPGYVVGQEYICGDGQIDGREVCDGENLNGKDCAGVGDFSGEDLACSSDCLSFDDSGCVLSEPEPECDLENLDLCLTENDCVGVGGYWYNESCNVYEQGAVCDSEHVGLCETLETCSEAEGYWYNESCNEDSCGNLEIDAGEVCDGTNLSGETCFSKGYAKGNLSCSSDCLSFDFGGCVVGTVTPLNFAINPSVIRDTILSSGQIPVYSFKIINSWENSIKDLRLDYDRSKFTVEPDEIFSIGVNESAYFNLTFKQMPRGAAKGVVVAYSGDVYEYLLFMFNLTDDEAQVRREYYQNNSVSTPSYYCTEIPDGKFCGSDESCSVVEVAALDGMCCAGQCEEESSGGGRAWIGYLVAGIVILVLLIIYVKYKKTKPAKDPMGVRVSQIEKG
ncbi:MAG: hypothetical protein KJ600_04540 [Nanoarchaeota archaeon]|nr:hypothetical protein [Nanoarchaeota archaeon]MBU1103796.1 hypothetical protein [Nanoarchaeota archaeon]